jgi:outer membrane protein assembly factor BamA
MLRTTIATRLILSTLLAVVRLSAQDTRADLIEAARDQKALELTDPQDPSFEKVIIRAEGSAFYRLLTADEGLGIGFGQLVPGAGFSVGPRYQETLMDGHLKLNGSLYGSTKKYYKVRFDASLVDLMNGHASVDFLTSHFDFPQMPYFGPGPDSRKTGRSDYRLENTTVGIEPTFKLIPHLTVGAVGDFIAINVGPGTSSKYVSTQDEYSPEVTPGIQQQTSYLKGGGFLQYDWRDKPGDPTRGGRYRAEYDKLSDQQFSAYSFYELNLDAQQYIPLFDGKRVIALHGETWLTDTNSTQVVPFYMQPTLGGPDTMRGFEEFRFYDNNAVLIQGEYRWEASSVLDLAIFADGGKVFHNWDELNLHNIEGDFGFGLRIKSASGTALRIDTGFSHEGVKVWFRVNNPF